MGRSNALTEEEEARLEEELRGFADFSEKDPKSVLVLLYIIVMKITRLYALLFQQRGPIFSK